MSNLQRIKENGLEMFIDLETGETFVSQSSILRNNKVSESNITQIQKDTVIKYRSTITEEVTTVEELEKDIYDYLIENYSKEELTKLFKISKEVNIKELGRLIDEWFLSLNFNENEILDIPPLYSSILITVSCIVNWNNIGSSLYNYCIN